MNRPFRLFMLFVSIVQAALALGFIFQFEPVLDLWPLPYTQPTAYIFIGSILAAAFASTLFCVLSDEPAAFAGIALDYIFIFIPLTIFAFQLAAPRTSGPLFNFAIAGASGALFGFALLMYSLRFRFRDTRPTPWLLRGAFVVFIVALVLVASQLITQQPNILPWRINSSASVVYGWMFLGAAAYFAYGLLRPRWHNAAGQLAGFLAYDFVLIGPLLGLVPTIPPNLRLNLIIYLNVVFFSGVLAVYYLFIHPRTRVFSLRAATAQPAG